jgi:sulfatase maturation enzyme AslB (radical SAM superfamily)
MDLSHCQYIYFAGGEPLLNSQHYELLAHLINNNIDPRLQYSTNMTVLGTKDYSVKDFWPYFTDIRVNASIDVVGENISSVRSGAKWKVIERNLNWMRKQKNVDLFVAPVISALSIWWIDELFSYFDWLPVENLSPTLVYSSGPHQLGIIPMTYRYALIDKLQSSKFHNNPIIKEAILDLQNTSDNQELWIKFVASQLALDKRRNESWFDNLPIRDKLFQEIAYNNFNWL